jgi:hypothetical protein
MVPRCAWSNRLSDEVKEVIIVAPDRLGLRPAPRAFYVLPEFEQDLRRFMERVSRFGLAFVLLMILLSIGVVMAAATSHQFVGLAVGLMGVMLVVFPFASPQVVNAIGIQKSITFARSLGVGLIGFAFYLGLTLR